MKILLRGLREPEEAEMPGKEDVSEVLDSSKLRLILVLILCQG